MQLLIEAGNTYVKVAQLFKNGQLELLGKYSSRKLEMVLEPLLDKKKFIASFLRVLGQLK